MSRGVAVFLVTTLGFAAARAQPVLDDRYFDSDGVRIRFVASGQGEPVVLVHGYTRSIELEWGDSGVLGDLSRDHRVIALDLRGHGKSDKPRDPAAYGEQMARDIVRLLTHLRIPRAHVVGYSLGAVLTAKLVTLHPDRVITATLGGSAGRLRPWSAEEDAAAEAAAQEMEHGVPFRSVIVATSPADEPPPSEEMIRRRSQEIAATNDPIAMAAYNRRRREFVVSPTDMAAVTVPMLAIIGSADRSLSGMHELKGILPTLETWTIESATHGGARGALRSPQFAAAVRLFIARHRSQ